MIFDLPYAVFIAFALGTLMPLVALIFIKNKKVKRYLAVLSTIVFFAMVVTRFVSVMPFFVGLCYFMDFDIFVWATSASMTVAWILVLMASFIKLFMPSGRDLLEFERDILEFFALNVITAFTCAGAHIYLEGYYIYDDSGVPIEIRENGIISHLKVMTLVDLTLGVICAVLFLIVLVDYYKLKQEQIARRYIAESGAYAEQVVEALNLDKGDDSLTTSEQQEETL